MSLTIQTKQINSQGQQHCPSSGASGLFVKHKTAFPVTKQVCHNYKNKDIIKTATLRQMTFLKVFLHEYQLIHMFSGK